jgi:hypothetical protein
MFVKPACVSPFWLTTSRAVMPCEEPLQLVSKIRSEVQAPGPQGLKPSS